MLLSCRISTVSEAHVLCKRCNANLPDGSQFCLKCGQPVPSPANSTALAPAQVLLPATVVPVTARPPRRITLWLLCVILLGVMVWAANSESPAAQQVQEFVRWSHAQTIVDTSTSVNPRSFSSTKFTVPQGALSVSITGEFSATAANPRDNNTKKAEKAGDRGNDPVEAHDPGIEAYVLTDAAFAVWSSGYSTATLYESGPIAGAVINAPLPTGAGVYHLVFSNKTSSRAKSVHATVLLRYKSWMPDEVVRLKDRFWNWIGL
jgi:hypothetical protein